MLALENAPFLMIRSDDEMKTNNSEEMPECGRCIEALRWRMNLPALQRTGVLFDRNVRPTANARTGLTRIFHTPAPHLHDLLAANDFRFPHRIAVDMPQSAKAVGDQNLAKLNHRSVKYPG